MAITSDRAATLGRRRLAWAVLGVLAGGLVVVLLLSWRRPPQMGADEAVFKTVDALYTAVRNQDELRLTQCEQRLASYREAGKLPRPSADYLNGIIATARGGDWQAAARRLYEFMMAQRREGEAPATSGTGRARKNRPAEQGR